MRRSDFMWFDDCDQVLNNSDLSAEFSEWLFAVQFWEKLNARFDIVNFGQYEDEVISSDFANEVAASLRRMTETVRGNSNALFVFCYGWNALGERLIVQIAKDEVLVNLKQLAEYLEDASKAGHRVYCQL